MKDFRPKHTQEFKDIVEKIPDKFSSMILIGLFLFFSVALLLSFIIKALGKVDAVVKVTSSNPPIVQKSYSSGKIYFLKDNFPANVQRGEYFAFIENPSTIENVKLLKSKIANFDLQNYSIDSLFGLKLNLGEIESSFFHFRIKLQNHLFLKNNSQHKFEMDMLSRKIRNDSIIIDQKRKILKNNLLDSQIKKKMQETDSVLFSQNAILENEYNKTRLAFTNTENHVTTLNIEIHSGEKSIIDNQLQRNNIEIEYQKALLDSEYSVLESLQNLETTIKEWERKYIFISDQDGVVELVNVIANGNFIVAGEPIFFLSQSQNQYRAFANLSSFGSGDVKVGQKVNLMLDLYPYQEYGMLLGEVSAISRNTIDGLYIVDINLKNGLTSTNSHEFSFAETMYGKAEIITEDKRLISIIFHQIYKLFNNKDSAKKDTELNPQKDDNQK